jgi:hypothetical protein
VIARGAEVASIVASTGGASGAWPDDRAILSDDRLILSKCVQLRQRRRNSVKVGLILADDTPLQQL